MSIHAGLKLSRGAFMLDVDIEFPRQGVSAIFGPSGSGKTTLLRAVAGLEYSKESVLQIGDETWQRGDLFVPAHRRSVGYVFQEANLFPHLDVKQNIEYGRKRIPAAQRTVNVHDVVELLGIEPFLARRPDQLSGGEQQRVAIARALAASPSVLLMDEPMASLDVALKQEILPYLESLHRELEIPVLYVSHSREEVLRLADFVVVLNKGRVRRAGPVSEMVDSIRLPGDESGGQESLIEGTVSAVDDAFGLTHVVFDGGEFVLPGRNLPVGLKVRLLVRAADVSVALKKPSLTSIQNVLEAEVEKMEQESSSQVNLHLRIGSISLAARITRKSAEILEIRPGTRVFAQVKSVALNR